MARSFFERLTGTSRAQPASDGDFVESDANAARPDLVEIHSERTVVSETRSARALPARGRIGVPAKTNKMSTHTIEEDESKGEEETAPESEGQLMADIYDDGDVIIVQSTIAGAKADELDISFEIDTVTIRGTRKRPTEVANDRYFYRELYWGPFSRSIVLPEEVDFTRSEASMKNGILTIRIPKREKAGKKLKVRMG